MSLLARVPELGLVDLINAWPKTHPVHPAVCAKKRVDWSCHGMSQSKSQAELRGPGVSVAALDFTPLTNTSSIPLQFSSRLKKTDPSAPLVLEHATILDLTQLQLNLFIPRCCLFALGFHRR